MPDEISDIKLGKCGRCNSVFLRIHSQVCETCLDEEEEDYRKIRDELSKNTSGGIEDIAKAAGVAISCVLRMLDVGLITNEGVGNPARCGQCGEPALNVKQRLCQKCLIELDQRLSHELSELRLQLKMMNGIEAGEVHETLRGKRRRN